MARLTRRTGWSLAGRAPRRVRSMTYPMPPGTEPSTRHAIAARHGFTPGAGWVKRPDHRLVIPAPTFWK